jgi:hypothetical protein
MLPAESDAWLQSFSLGAYRPMVRLASDSDRLYLETTGSPHVVRNYRRKQRGILREYLKVLARDFQRLLDIAATSQPLAFFESQLSFIFGVLWIEARLVFEALVPHTIDLEPLLESVETLAASAREIASPALRLHVT